MYLLKNPVRSYAWGSITAIPDLLGVPPDGRRQAELWLGAHPDSPSAIHQSHGHEALDRAIQLDPDSLLGSPVHSRFGARLPFLLKVLAAERPLSLQVHPTEAQAADGFIREERAGVPTHAAHRNYKDSHHKPEMVMALTRFEALCGFRHPSGTIKLLEGLNSEWLDHWRIQLQNPNPSEGLRNAFTDALVMLPGHPEVIASVAELCRVRLAEGSPYPLEDRTVVDLSMAYPGDPGALISLLLNRVSLTPGDAMFLGPGKVHAYLQGTAIELMANSDNVLRGGLTAKHIDVPELLQTVDMFSGPAPRVLPRGDAKVQVWRTPAEEFELARVNATMAPVTLTASGPRIALCLEGHAKMLSDKNEPIDLKQGQSVFIPAAEGAVTINGRATIVLASVRQSEK